MCVRVCARMGKSEWGSVGAREVGTGKGERESKKEGGYNGVALSFFWVTRPLSSLQRPCRNKRISFEWRFFLVVFRSQDFWNSNVYFFSAILNSGMVLVAGYSIFPSLHMQHSAASVVFCPWLHHQHHPLHSCTPHPVQIHLHPLMISVKNCWHRMRQGGGRRLIWIKLDCRVDTALKVSRPFMSRWQGVCVLGGSAWDCQRGLFESGRIFEAREWKGVDHKARHTSNTTRHIFTLSIPCRQRVYKEGRVSVLWHGLQNEQQKIKHVDHKVDHRGFGVLKRGFPRFSFGGSLWFVQIKYSK